MTQESIAKKALSEWQEELAEKDKQIADLEKACDETQELLDKQIEATYKLDKENAELKEELKKWKDEWQEQVQKATDEGYARTLQTMQLTKAKEIIKSLLETPRTVYKRDREGEVAPYESMAYARLKEEAEQFLNSEVK